MTFDIDDNQYMTDMVKNYSYRTRLCVL